MAHVNFSVNGKQFSAELDPAMPLLWALRDVLNLTGTKFGCGMGLCGACTVHLDGEAVRSCQTAVGSVGNKKVTTIEGLSPDRSHPVQRAWIAEQVPQCGYCQPAQVIAATALLYQVRSPTDDDIDQAMAGIACRCGTYSRIRAAIHLAAKSLAEL